ncbi:SDR family oxidoreductase [Mycoplana rhizolycopersici]|uniref:SDR family oxidoreductase n=1 Tax=Mycoplana rhizolycopersici TaxID=2746702 RepID=UPI0024846E70|nr:SDR family oxidoreductase [Rhizobium rhizolycopersici]
MKRCGGPSEIASTILFLTSPAASCVTGSILSVDVGYTALRAFQWTRLPSAPPNWKNARPS